MALAMGLENCMFHICSHYAKRVNRSLKEEEGLEGWTSELFCHFPSKYRTCGHARAVAHFKRIVWLREDQAMRQETPTLWLLQTSCEKDEKGGSMDHLPPY
jgi:hypothetical protein